MKRTTLCNCLCSCCCFCFFCQLCPKYWGQPYPEFQVFPKREQPCLLSSELITKRANDKANVTSYFYYIANYYLVKYWWLNISFYFILWIFNRLEMISKFQVRRQLELNNWFKSWELCTVHS